MPASTSGRPSLGISTNSYQKKKKKETLFVETVDGEDDRRLLVAAAAEVGGDEGEQMPGELKGKGISLFSEKIEELY